MTRRRLAAALTAAAVLVCTAAISAVAATPTDTTALRGAVTVGGVRAHQTQFQGFANQSSGTREASTLGYQLSADYVADLMDGAGYDVTRQSFPYNFFQELAPPTVVGTSAGFPFTYADGVDISTMDYSGSGTVSGVVQGVNDNIVPLPVGQPDGTSNAGCEDSDFAGFTGDIALVQRGTCFFSDKIANASRGGRRRRDHLQRGQQPGAVGRRLRLRELPAGRSRNRDERRRGRRPRGVHRGRGNGGTGRFADGHDEHGVRGAPVRERDRTDDRWSHRPGRRRRAPTSTPCPRARASTTTARDRRCSSRSRSRWRRWTSSPSTR